MNLTATQLREVLKSLPNPELAHREGINYFKVVTLPEITITSRTMPDVTECLVEANVLFFRLSRCPYDWVLQI